jgi:hypothetical protein
MTTFMRNAVAAAIGVLAVIGLTIHPAGIGGPVSVASPSPTDVASEGASPLDTSIWKSYTSDRYGFLIGYPPDWQLISADHTWSYANDLDWRSHGQEWFRAPDASIRVAAWSVQVPVGTTADAWISKHCEDTGETPCTNMPSTQEALDGHPGTLVRFDGDTQSFFLIGDRMYMLVAWQPESDSSAMPYGGATRLLEAYLSTMHLLPAGPAESSSPSPSPAGSASTSDAGELAYGLDGSVYLASADGHDPVKIADGALGAGGFGPAAYGSFWGEGRIWSPDGQHLAYRGAWDSSCPAAPGGNVFLADSTGRVVSSFDGQGWNIAWSPDSSRVATWVELGKTVGIFGLDGARQASLSVPSGCRLPDDFDPRWSPDGASVVIWPCEVPLDGSSPRQLEATDPRSYNEWAYSPDGMQVAYIDGGTIVVAALDDAQPPIRFAVAADDIRWSPSSDRIAFDSVSASGHDKVGVIDVASGSITSVAESGATDHLSLIGFAPTADRLLFSRSDTSSVGTGSLERQHRRIPNPAACGWYRLERMAACPVRFLKAPLG